MPYVQSFRADLNLVYTRFDREVSLESVRRCAIDTYRDPGYVAGMRELIDMRDVAVPDPRFSYETIREIWESQASWIRVLREHAQVVIVSDNDLVFGLARIYASLAARDSVRVTPCRDWDFACGMLGLDRNIDLFKLTARG